MRPDGHVAQGPVAGPTPGRARHANRRRSPGGVDVERTGAQTAVVLRKEKVTATTSTAGTPKRFRQLAGGYERPLNCFAVLGEVAGGLFTTPNVRSGCAPCKGGAFQWVQAPPGNRSSRKQSEQSWRHIRCGCDLGPEVSTHQREMNQ
jgi:hypothetical protein